MTRKDNFPAISVKYLPSLCSSRSK